MFDLKEWIAKVTDWLKNKSYTGYGTQVDISGYNTYANAYTVPADGLVRIFCNYRSASYIQAYVDNEIIIQSSSTNNYNMVGSNIQTLQVFKGQKVHIVRSSSYSNAQFIPFVGGVICRLLNTLQSLTFKGVVVC